MNSKIDEICPQEVVKVSQFDGKINSLALQKLARRKKREYTKKGCSKKYKDLKKNMKKRIKIEGEKSIERLLENAKFRGMKWVREATRLSARPGEDKSTTFSLQNHIDSNFTAQQSAQAICSHFAAISQEFTPIEEDKSSRWMEAQKKLSQQECSHPSIMEHDIYKNMKSAKRTDSVPGDIPCDILKEFLPEFTTPITAIIKEAVQTHTWPAIYKKEYHIPLKKVPSPESEDDIRGIGLTSWVSKQLERYVLNWIWPFIKPHIDPDQMGGIQGCSIEHYIIKMLHFILTSMDGNRNSAVLAVPVDFSKAFNRMSHSDILCNFSDINVPPCAIKLIQSYLSGRSMCVRYKGTESTFEKCPGGGPQGGLLTGVLFILQVNKAGSPCPSSRQEHALVPTEYPIQSPQGRKTAQGQSITKDRLVRIHPSGRKKLNYQSSTRYSQMRIHPPGRIMK